MRLGGEPCSASSLFAISLDFTSKYYARNYSDDNFRNCFVTQALIVNRCGSLIKVFTVGETLGLRKL